MYLPYAGDHVNMLEKQKELNQTFVKKNVLGFKRTRLKLLAHLKSFSAKSNFSWD